MSVTQEIVSPGQCALRITVAAERVDQAFEDVLVQNLAKVTMQGFRKGKVPENVARVKVPDAALKQLVINRLVPLAYKEAIGQLGLSPLGGADTNVVECERGHDLVFECTLQVMPLLPITGYRGFLVQRPATDDEIATTIISNLVEQIPFEVLPAQLREGHAKLAFRKRQAQLEGFGISMELHLEQKGLTPEQFAQELSAIGLVEARLEVLYRSIAHAENLSVLQSELNQAVQSQAQSTGESVEAIRRFLEDQQEHRLFVYRILISKIRDLLVAHAVSAPPAPQASKKAKAKAKGGMVARADSKSKAKPAAKGAAKAGTVDGADSKSKAKPAAKGAAKAGTVESPESKPKAKPAAKGAAKAGTVESTGSKSKAKPAAKGAAKAGTVESPESKPKAKPAAKAAAKAGTVESPESKPKAKPAAKAAAEAVTAKKSAKGKPKKKA